MELNQPTFTRPSNSMNIMEDNNYQMQEESKFDHTSNQWYVDKRPSTNKFQKPSSKLHGEKYVRHSKGNIAYWSNFSPSKPFNIAKKPDSPRF